MLPSDRRLVLPIPAPDVEKSVFAAPEWDQLWHLEVLHSCATAQCQSDPDLAESLSCQGTRRLGTVPGNGCRIFWTHQRRQNPERINKDQLVMPSPWQRTP
jgi:hypothetical protein